MNKAVLDMTATKAIHAFASEVTVVVNPEGRADRLGSGILMYRPGGRVLVLTAAHVVQDTKDNINIDASSLGVASRLRNAVRSVHIAPPLNGHEVDVACLQLTDDAASSVSALGAPITMLHSNEVIGDGDFLVLTGQPTGLMIAGNKTTARPDDTGRPQLDVDVVQLFYITSYRGRDSLGRISVEWGDALVSGATTTATRPGWIAGQRVELGSPVGISGAGLWRFIKPRDQDIWSPRSHGQLLGVAVAWNKIDTQFCEPGEHFERWLTNLT